MTFLSIVLAALSVGIVLVIRINNKIVRYICIISCAYTSEIILRGAELRAIGVYILIVLVGVFIGLKAKKPICYYIFTVVMIAWLASFMWEG